MLADTVHVQAVLVRLELHNLNVVKDLQAAEWLRWLKTRLPILSADVLEQAADDLIEESQSNGYKVYATSADLLKHIKKIHKKRLEAIGGIPIPPAELPDHQVPEFQKHFINQAYIGASQAQAVETAKTQALTEHVIEPSQSNPNICTKRQISRQIGDKTAILTHDLADTKKLA